MFSTMEALHGSPTKAVMRTIVQESRKRWLGTTNKQEIEVLAEC